MSNDTEIGKQHIENTVLAQFLDSLLILTGREGDG
jgi:hypothetical protein